MALAATLVKCDRHAVESSLMSRLFDDKSRSFLGRALRAETTFSFLDRSSMPEFQRIREMLERWVARLPEKQRHDTIANMRSRAPGSQPDEYQFSEAFFELFLHEFLLATRGAVVAEPMIDGRTPDFKVTEELEDGSDLTYVVEAISFDLERGTKLERNWNELTVLDTIDEICSPDFRLDIQMGGELESSPPRAHLKETFRKLLRGANYEELIIAQEQQRLHPANVTSASFQHGSWKVTGQLRPVSPERRGKDMRFVGIVSKGADNIDDIGKTKDRIYGKAKRYKDVENLIIALRCDISNNRLDEVLFGSQQVTLYVHNDPTDTTPLPEPYNSQRLNGFWFNTGGPTNQHVVGVVAFYGIYPRSPSED